VSFVTQLKKSLKNPPKHRQLPRKKAITLSGARESDLWSFAKVGLSVTALELWLTCREQFRLRYAEGLRTHRTSAALDYGNLWHWILSRAHDKRYRKAMDLDKQLREVDAEWKEDHPNAFEKPIQDWHQSLAKVRALWPVYAQKFKGDWSRDWVGVEMPFRVGYEMPKQRTYLHGIFDGVYREKGKLWLLETKTKSQIDEFEIEDTLHLDNQVMMYLWCLRLTQGEMPVGVEYNVIRNPGTRMKCGESLPEYGARLSKEIKKDEDHYFKRWHMPVSAARLEDWHANQFRPIMMDVESWACYDGPHYINTKSLIGKYGRCDMFNFMTKGDTADLTQRQPRKLEKDR
jgi:hypothetical protein